MSWKQFLTEKILEEKWLFFPKDHTADCSCYDCVDCRKINRHYNNPKDLISLYSTIRKRGDWTEFFDWSDIYVTDSRGYDHPISMAEKTAMLFCLNSDKVNHEHMCKEVAIFYGWKETSSIVRYDIDEQTLQTCIKNGYWNNITRDPNMIIQSIFQEIKDACNNGGG